MERPIRTVLVSSYFEKRFKGLPAKIQELARKRDKIFRKNAFSPSLKTHKLSGGFKNDWAYSINRNYRVHFYFIDDHAVMYVNAGTHEVYK